MKSLLRLLLLGLVLVLVALLSALTAMRFAIHGREVVVPALAGKTAAEAEPVLLATGLTLEVEDRFYSQNVREGGIVSQLPLPGTRVRRGWRVRVAVSLGPQRAPVPNVLGETGRAAEINIQRRGLEVSTVAVAHLPGVPAGQVVAQDPPPDAGGMASPKVSLLVTPASDAQTLVMPDFTGRRLAEAISAVEAAGLRLGKVTMLTSATAPATPPGPANPTPAPAAVSESASAAAGASPSQPQIPGSAIVARQSPAAGQKVAPGMVVSFDVSP